jgi:hypothetical protein
LASSLISTQDSVPDRPKSPWTPSYSVTIQGSPPLDGRNRLESSHADASNIPSNIDLGDTSISQSSDLPETDTRTSANPIGDVPSPDAAPNSASTGPQENHVPSFDTPTNVIVTSDTMSSEGAPHISLSDEDSVDDTAPFPTSKGVHDDKHPRCSP